MSLLFESKKENPIENCFNVEIEQALLGCMLTRPELFIKLAGLHEHHFYDDFHKRIYAEAFSLVLDGKSISPAILGEKLGNKSYVVSLLTSAIYVTNPEDYAAEVINLHCAREIILSCLESNELLRGGSVPAEVAASLTAKISGLVEQRVGLSIRDDFKVTEEILEDMKKKHKPISTGLDKLDEAMGGGLHPGMSYGFAARKKVGKTVLASSISYNLNERGVPHLFIACEMGAKQIHQRNLARACDLYPSVFRNTEHQTPDKLKAIANYAVKSNRCIHYMDAPGLTFDGLKQAVSVAISKHKISGFILDYWQLVGGKRKNQSTSEHLDEVAQWIADFCRKHEVWSVVMGQINQEGNTRGGEGMRLAFDQVYQIHREDVSQPGAWLEMMDTRYTKWVNIGSKDYPGLMMAEKSPYFFEA